MSMGELIVLSLDDKLYYQGIFEPDGFKLISTMEEIRFGMNNSNCLD
jgi:hypothetical protein